MSAQGTLEPGSADGSGPDGDDGEHARQRGRVAEVQRARALTALYEVCAEQEAARLSVGAIVARAGISRRTFYELFDSGEACLLAALQQAIAHVQERVLAAWRPQQPWRVRVRAALLALLAHLDDEPLRARLLIVDSLATGPHALQLRTAALAPAMAAVAAGEDARSRSRAPLSPLLAEGIVGGVLSVLHTRLTAPAREPTAARDPATGAAGPPPATAQGSTPADLAARDSAAGAVSPSPPARLLDLANDLMALIVLPYLGPAAAAAELEREVSPPAVPAAARRRSARSGGDPLDGLSMRITYRTMRVLAAVAAHPGASNRPIGRAAGVDDQGQISKLLWRLAGLDLVANDGAGQGPGTRNAWSLTERGQELYARVASAGALGQG